jgi:hypothetical protein
MCAVPTIHVRFLACQRRSSSNKALDARRRGDMDIAADNLASVSDDGLE